MEFIYIVAPRLALPGADYYMLTVVLLPLAWTVMKAKARAAVAAV